LSRDPQSHLSFDELELLADAEVEVRECGTFDLRQAEAHAEVCDACRSHLRDRRFLRSRLRKKVNSVVSKRESGCPTEEIWMRVAAGLTSSPDSQALLEHASRCDYCGRLLQIATEDMNPERSTEEERIIASLPSSQPNWQRPLAAKLAAVSAPALSDPASVSRFSKRSFLAFTPRWAFACLAAMLFVAIGSWMYFRVSEQSVDRLLARAYTDQRTLDLRLPGAQHAPLQVERGAGRSSLAKPAPLLKAEYEITQRLSARPEDAGLLAAKGRAEVLEWQYDAAILSLKHALDLKPDSPEVLCDLATAYTERGDAQNRPLDYGQAIEYLGQALSARPDNTVALFNRALVDERLSLFEEAIKDWEHYLRLDPKGPWSEEARQRLTSLRLRLKQSYSFPPAEHSPDKALPSLEAREQRRVVDSAAWLDSLDEDYLDLAIKEWLPALAKRISESGGSPDALPEWQSLQTLSRVVASEHGDPWLADLLSAKRSPGLLRGWSELGTAAQFNSDGDFDAAASASADASRLLTREGCTAGALRALWEESYALQRAQQGSACLRATGQATQTGNLKSYRWISTQLVLETSVCSAMVGQLQNAQRGIQRAVEMAESARYGTLLLRGMHMAGVEVAAADPERSWIWFQKGLKRHWTGAYRPFRAYQFYAEMSFTPENRHQWYLARELMDEATVHISRTSNRSTEAVARYSLAVDEQMSGDSSGADEEFHRAATLFSSLPRTPTTRTFLFSSEVYRAALEAQQGRNDLALASLAAARHEYTEESQYRIWLHYYEALGTTLLNSGRTEDAEKALRAAVYIGEAALASLKTEEDRLLWEQSAARGYRSLVEVECERKGDSEYALELWEWYIASGIRSSDNKAAQLDFSALGSGPPLPMLTLVEDSMPKLRSVTVISFAQLGNGTVVWVFDDRGVHRADIAVSILELSGGVRRFLRLCSEPRSDMREVRRTSRQLYDWLIAPIEQYLTPARLLAIESDGDLAKIPFNALLTGKGDFLGERFEIAMSPGLQLWNLLRHPAALLPEDRILVVGVSAGATTQGDDLPPLADAQVEIREVASHFPHSAVLLNDEATFAALRRELPSVRVFHFVGHAIARADRNGLLLAASRAEPSNAPNSGFVDAWELEELRMPKLELVVLSACATAVDDEGLVDPQSLVRVFLRAGASQVVASRWNVDSSSTTELMKLFYNFLAAGQDPPSALKEAQQALRSQPATSHPYYWASFEVFGRSRQN
jgi:CHAT domain-containing protein/cytochrome c-type biogenesis protein CcmH/NrfG